MHHVLIVVVLFSHTFSFSQLCQTAVWDPFFFSSSVRHAALLRAPQSSAEPLRRPPLHGRRAGIIGNNGAVLARVNHSGRNGAKVGGARRGRGAKGERKDDEGPERRDGRQKVSRGRRRTEVSKRQEAQGGREER